MRLLSLELRDFRNHRRAIASLEGESTLLSGADAFEVRGLARSRAGAASEIFARGSARGPREVRVDGAPLSRLAELLGRFLDVALCQIEPAYVGHLRDYNAALRQRNRLLADSRGAGEVEA